MNGNINGNKVLQRLTGRRWDTNGCNVDMMRIYWRQNGDIMGMYRQGSDMGTMVSGVMIKSLGDIMRFIGLLMGSTFFSPRNGCIRVYTGIEWRYNRDII